LSVAISGIKLDIAVSLGKEAQKKKIPNNWVKTKEYLLKTAVQKPVFDKIDIVFPVIIIKK